ncbi:MAG TPA: cytochrome c-type biogenesis protein CcmH [Acidimicrobiales bacterium]|nr:cytochrome c-type biogenesis protein CcmH [Acidimicrobiales bacterium]
MRRGARLLRANALWVAAALAIGLSLAAGAGAFGLRGPPPTLYERTLQVAGQYRCPVCQGETVASSDAPEAVEIKQLVQEWLSQGKSPDQVKAYLLSRYGPSVLERPPASGLGTLLWALPVVVVVLATAGLGAAFYRWRRPRASRARPVPSPTVPRPSPGRRIYQRLTLIGGIGLVVLAGALWLVDRASAPRGPGGTVSGGPTAITSELEQAVGLTSSDPAAALALYDRVLSVDPAQVVALTGEGWLYAEAGFVKKGAALLAAAERLAPSYAPAHLYRAFVLLDYEHHLSGAVAELKWYLSHGPGPSLEATAKEALTAAERGTSAPAGPSPRQGRRR